MVRWLSMTRAVVAALVLGLVLGAAAAVASSSSSSNGMFTPKSGARRPANLAAKGCDVTITSPALEVGKRRVLRNTDSLTVAFAGSARRCPSSAVTFWAKVGAGADTLLDAGTTSAAGAWSYSLAATDQASTVFSARMTSAGGVATQAQATVDADTRLPKLVLTTPAGDSFDVLRVVAASEDAGCGSGGNVHVDDREPGWLADVGCDDGGQVSPSIGVTGASGGTLVVTYDGVVLADAGVTSSPQTLTAAELGTWTLPSPSRGDLVVTATNATGSTSRTLLTQVLSDVPPSITGPDGGAVLVEILDYRKATVRVSYVLPSVPAGVGARIELAWTTGTVLGSAPAAQAVTRTTQIVGAAPVAIADPATLGRTGVVIHNCGTTADGGTTIWCSTSPDVAVDAGTRVPYTQSASCSATDMYSPAYQFDTVVDGGMASYSPDCPIIWSAQRTLYCVAESGTSQVRPEDAKICMVPTGANYRTAGRTLPLWMRSSECALYDAEASPQVWECEGQRIAAGQVRSKSLRLPPLNTYFVMVRQVY